LTATALDISYRYPYPSSLDVTKGQARLRLAACGGTEAAPHFFRGRLVDPAQGAALLLAVSKVAQSRFYTPPAMVQRILREADPVVTSGGERLRFESFSLCCGVYARADFLPDAIEGDVLGRGTTNVDLNGPFRAALAQVKKGDEVALDVGCEHVALEQESGRIEERKVKLPQRWLKGFVEAQTYGRGLALRHEIPGPEARRFLAELSAAVKAKDRCHLNVKGRQLRLSQRAAADALPIGGIGRLKLLEPLARLADSLRIYGTPDNAVTAWVLDLGAARFELLLSPEAGRGFSGEGQALSTLASGNIGALARVRASLAWQAKISAADLAGPMDARPEEVERALAALGSQGLVGFDLSDTAYFHREMPFDLAKLDKLHPRLAAARELVRIGAVRLLETPGAATEAFVKSGDLEHRVVLEGISHRCSCPWFNRMGGEAGPCKHVLAVQIHRDSRDSSGASE
jgi:hypothetical protein